MIPADKIVSYDLRSDEDAGSVALSELSSRMSAAGLHRIPILNASRAVVYVVHDSTIAAFALSVNEEPSQLTGTMATLVQNADFKSVVEAIGIVGPDAVLADARAAMRAVEQCNDVFVTESGKKTDRVIGWLTNTDLASTDL